MRIETTFWVGDYVHVDGDKTLRMRVLEVLLGGSEIEQYKLGWVKPSGDFADQWFAGWRLAPDSGEGVGVAEIIAFKTPSGGRSSISAALTPKGGVQLQFQRHAGTPGEGEYFGESLAIVSPEVAEKVAREILRLLGKA